ncbi:MAG TPA: ABC transporter permease [Magnetospirillaceae bacterium]|jgi:peptide/nickel transport system permease protein
MSRRLLYRLIQALVVLLVLSFVIYGLIGLMPGDPIELMAAGSPHMTAEDVARLKALYGVGTPLIPRYLHWLGSALGGDLGYSRLTGLSVLKTLGPPLGHTMALMFSSLIVAMLIALPLGVVAAMRHRRLADHTLNLAAFAAISLPTFWVALILIMIFSVSLAWLPTSGVETPGGGGVVDRLRHLVLPVAALALLSFGHYLRYMRAAMIATLREDWIRTARAKGASWMRVATHHALRNALVPVTTILALDFGSLFSGVVVTEAVFGYPGTGKLIFDAIMGNDYNLALAALMLATATTLIGSILADLAYSLLDPRVGFR